MKELKLYQCEFCGTKYNSKDKAMKCEKLHHKATGFIDSRYHAAECDNDGYPDLLEVKFDNGEVRRYRRG